MNTFRAMRTCAAQLLGKQEHAVEQLAERIASSVGASSSAALPFSSTTWSGWSASAGCLSNLATRTFASKGAGAGKGKDAAGRGSDIKSGASAKDALAAAAGAAPTALNAPVSKKPSAYPSLPLPPGLDSLIPPARPYELVPDLPQRKVEFPAQYVPWTPTRRLQRRRKISKRMAFLVQVRADLQYH